MSTGANGKSSLKINNTPLKGLNHFIPSQYMKFNDIFFIGIAGSGMSALAQYLAGKGMKVGGSDRYFEQGQALDIRE